MKININGIVRDMAPEELAEYERMQQEMPSHEPSEADILRERIAALEAAGLERDMALIELAAMLAGGGL